MKESLHLYASLVRASLLAQMQYRASFLLMVFANALITLAEFGGMWALFHRFGSLRGWKLEEVGFFYGMVNLSIALGEGVGRGFDKFGVLVKSGDFDRLLVRPRSTVFQVAAGEVLLTRLGRMAVAGTVLVWSLHRLPIFWNPGTVLFLLTSILSGSVLFYGLFVFQATVCFWTTEGLEIMNVVTYGGTEVSQYPLTIYSGWVRGFFTVIVPFACINLFPAGILFGKTNVQLPTSSLQWLSPLAGVVFLTVTLRFWSFGEKRYRSTGS